MCASLGTTAADSRPRLLDRFCRAALAVLLIAVLSPQALAQEGIASSDLAYITRILHVFYPEFREAAVVRVSFGVPIAPEWPGVENASFEVWPKPPDDSQDLIAGCPPPACPPKRPVSPRRLLLKGTFQYFAFWSFSVDESSPVRFKEIRLRKLCAAHPNWTQPHVIRALNQAGARFGPSERTGFERLLPWPEMESLFGEVTAKTIEFEVMDGERVGTSAVDPRWRVGFQAQLRGEGPFRYSLAFEPFAGRLTSLTRFPVTAETLPAPRGETTPAR
jgi:hypothetical protein